MKILSVKKAMIAISTLACASLFSFGWSDKGVVSVSIHKAEAQTRVYVGRLYRGGYMADPSLPWYAIRAYYNAGPWTYSYSGWTDYAARNGIGCTPGTLVKGGDGINYTSQ
jgi:hypothetical protein